FLGCVTLSAAVLALVALLDYHGVYSLPRPPDKAIETVADQTEEFLESLKNEGHVGARLDGTGLFKDSNEFALVMVVGLLFSLALLTTPGATLSRLPWLGTCALFGYCLMLTHSRGGFLALLSGLLVLCSARFGWRRALLLCGAALPLFLVLF